MFSHRSKERRGKGKSPTMSTPMAYATYSKLSSTSAIVEVNYSNGDFGMQRVDVRPGADLYAAAYSAASIKATIQGDRLERFSAA
jgi:hypothetical protein